MAAWDGVGRHVGFPAEAFQADIAVARWVDNEHRLTRNYSPRTLFELLDAHTTVPGRPGSSSIDSKGMVALFCFRGAVPVVFAETDEDADGKHRSLVELSALGDGRA